MYSLEVLNNLKDKLNLELEINYNKKEKYISTTKIGLRCTFQGCNEVLEIKFDSLLKNEKAHCKYHRYSLVGEKISKTKSKKSKPIYDENRKKLYEMVTEMNIQLVGDYNNIDVKENTDICYFCIYTDCNKTGTKQFHTLMENKLPYCNEHHYLLHNTKINSDLRNQNKITYDEYNDILDKLKDKYPQVNLTWNRDTIRSHAEISFNCINPRCNEYVCKLFQHILQNKENINEVYFGCNDCKFYISESLRDDVELLINTTYFNEVVEQPKQINYITTCSSFEIKWRCLHNCINCNKGHTYTSSPRYRFIDWSTDCPLCLNPNKCDCVADGFICSKCNLYFCNELKCSHTNICKICKSKSNDDDLDKIFKRFISNCVKICSRRQGDRSIMNLDIDYLKQLYEEQQGLCWISKNKMSLKTHSDFKISIERLNEEEGYIKGNVKFICLEFQNGFRQWNPEKFNSFCNDYNEFQEIPETDTETSLKNYNGALLKKTKHFNKRKKQQKPYNNKEEQKCLCRTCDLIKSYDKFSTDGINNGICKECKKEKNDKRKEPSLRAKLKNLVTSSKRGIDLRNTSKWRKETPLIHTLTFEELLNIYLQQFGRCAYSNRPLTLHGDYMMSLERINTSVGYTKDNCCLICVEFNTADWSISKCSEDNRSGSSGWNKEKIKFIVDQYLS
jgi:hypothetical protein